MAPNPFAWPWAWAMGVGGLAFAREKNGVGCGYTFVTASFFGNKKIENPKKWGSRFFLATITVLITF